jgi:DNA-binding transcriptional ArsR family regulator
VSSPGTEGPSLAKLAAVLAEPARAQMLSVLMSGQALTATELANSAGIARPTASDHLARLQAAGLLSVVAQGRHRYYRLAGTEVAEMLEQLVGIASRVGAEPLLVGPRDAQLREARVCYDHLAGTRAVAMLDRLLARDALRYEGPLLTLGKNATDTFSAFGIDVDGHPPARRPRCRACLDWSERRHHLAGALGASILTRIFELGWAQRQQQSRVVVFSAVGEKALRGLFS